MTERAAGIQLSLVPESPQIPLGDTTDLFVGINGLGDPPSLSTYDLTVNYDPTLFGLSAANDLKMAQFQTTPATIKILSAILALHLKRLLVESIQREHVHMPKSEFSYSQDGAKQLNS